MVKDVVEYLNWWFEVREFIIEKLWENDVISLVEEW